MGVSQRGVCRLEKIYAAQLRGRVPFNKCDLKLLVPLTSAG